MGRKTKDRPKVHITQPIELLKAGKVVGVINPIGTTLVEPIGRLITHWAAFENTIDDLLEAVLAINKTSALGWRSLNFAKRSARLKDEWGRFSEGQDDLIIELNDILALAHQGKSLRDMIAHKRITSGYSDRGMFVKFKNDLQVQAYTKEYYPEDISSAANKVDSAIVRLLNLKNGDPSSPVSSRSKPLLQRLRTETAYRPAPTRQVPSRPPRSSRT
jgi:hypothetical protein